MTDVMFFRGHADTEVSAVGLALVQCAPYLMDNAGLVVQLEGLTPMGKGWDADIRLMALSHEVADGQSHHRKQNDPGLRLDVDNPEHSKSDNPNAWRPVGMKHDGPIPAFRFSNAARGGELPDIPIEHMMVPDYELARASEPELRRILRELEEKRKKVIEDFKPKPDLD